MDADKLVELVTILRRGGVVSCPTETLQGLLADALSEQAVARVVALKQRGADPIAVLVPDLAAAEALCAEPLPEAALALARAHWPGPLTLVLRARAGLPSALAAQGTIGVRVPGASPALDLVRAFGAPLTATSCNLSGKPPAVTEAEVRSYFAGQLDAIVPGDAPGGTPSTVLDASGASLRVLRQGAIQVLRARGPGGFDP
jgi:tRNA threonylcarbamoyl adenosine modification protein (Sua5/YciO/YrdC/YwlC family)